MTGKTLTLRNDSGNIAPVISPNPPASAFLQQRTSQAAVLSDFDQTTERNLNQEEEERKTFSVTPNVGGGGVEVDLEATGLVQLHNENDNLEETAAQRIVMPRNYELE